MYGWLWRHLPGRSGARTVAVLLLLAAVLVLLFQWVFPAISDSLARNGATVGALVDRTHLLVTCDQSGCPRAHTGVGVV